MLTVQRARGAADFRRYRELQVEYEESLAPDLRHDLPDLHAIERAYEGLNAVFIAIVDGHPAGCVAVTTLDASTNVLKRLYVRPDYRQLGIARALIDNTIAFSREHDRRRIVLDTDRARLRAAFELYLRVGFSECASYGPVEYTNPTFMELHL